MDSELIKLPEEWEDVTDTEEDDDDSWEHRFSFPADDERKNDPKLEAFRESCKTCDLHRRLVKYTDYLKERIKVVEDNTSSFLSSLAVYAAYVVKTIKEHPMLITTTISSILAVCICGGLYRAKFIEKAGFFGFMFRLFLIAGGVLLIWALLRALPAMLETVAEIKDCKKTYQHDKEDLALYSSGIELLRDSLRISVKDGGVPEEYWDYGGILWSYVYSGKADTRSEAILCLTRDIRQVEMEMKLESLGE